MVMGYAQGGSCPTAILFVGMSCPTAINAGKSGNLRKYSPHARPLFLERQQGAFSCPPQWSKYSYLEYSAKCAILYITPVEDSPCLTGLQFTRKICTPSLSLSPLSNCGKSCAKR